MQFLLSVIVFLATDILLIWYLVNSEYFSPKTISGDLDVWNVALFVGLVSLAVGLTVSLIVFLVEKLLYCGWREFPPVRRAVKAGILVAIALAVVLAMHIFHVLSVIVVLVVCVLVIVGIIIIR